MYKKYENGMMNLAENRRIEGKNQITSTNFQAGPLLYCRPLDVGAWMLGDMLLNINNGLVS
jgi:hypothetical protein